MIIIKKKNNSFRYLNNKSFKIYSNSKFNPFFQIFNKDYNEEIFYIEVKKYS